MKHTICII